MVDSFQQNIVKSQKILFHMKKTTIISNKFSHKLLDQTILQYKMRSEKTICFEKFGANGRRFCHAQKRFELLKQFKFENLLELHYFSQLPKNCQAFKNVPRKFLQHRQNVFKKQNILKRFYVSDTCIKLYSTQNFWWYDTIHSYNQVYLICMHIRTVRVSKYVQCIYVHISDNCIKLYYMQSKNC
eukprot:TRINITY_DN16639_c1_g3_i1.p1 TRINITY_DN16639_c1_g3~~TRINITY_DN16639_c1_g3_i1.p1  ORF type:complete len:185 (-),score=-17.22 TRINITY_DN16639_c1_g3_i1:163-717(-)